MTGQRWILLALGTIAAAVGVAAGVSYTIDPYGVLRDSKGRTLAVYYLERKAKFLMSKRYVPGNFDGLVIGASESANWDVPELAGARVYNESLHGVSGTEERFVVDQALATGHFKLAVVLLAPPITSEHDFQDGLDSTKTIEALGSIHSIVNGVSQVLVARHVNFHNSHATPYGTDPFVETKGIYVRPLGEAYFHLDPVSVADLRGMVEELQGNGARVVYVVPPVYKPLHDLNEAGYQSYLESIRAALPPGPVIDFNAPEYAGLTGDSEMFFDCFHVKPPGAAAFSALMVKLTPEALASAK